jgi:hypothetical protein
MLAGVEIIDVCVASIVSFHGRPQSRRASPSSISHDLRFVDKLFHSYHHDRFNVNFPPNMRRNMSLIPPTTLA